MERSEPSSAAIVANWLSSAAGTAKSHIRPSDEVEILGTPSPKAERAKPELVDTIRSTPLATASSGSSLYGPPIGPTMTSPERSWTTSSSSPLDSVTNAVLTSVPSDMVKPERDASAWSATTRTSVQTERSGDVPMKCEGTPVLLSNVVNVPANNPSAKASVPIWASAGRSRIGTSSQVSPSSERIAERTPSVFRMPANPSSTPTTMSKAGIGHGYSAVASSTAAEDAASSSCPMSCSAEAMSMLSDDPISDVAPKTTPSVSTPPATAPPIWLRRVRF